MPILGKGKLQEQQGITYKKSRSIVRDFYRKQSAEQMINGRSTQPRASLRPERESLRSSVHGER